MGKHSAHDIKKTKEQLTRKVRLMLPGIFIAQILVLNFERQDKKRKEIK